MTVNRFQRLCTAVVAGILVAGSMSSLPAKAEPPPGQGAKNWQNLPPGTRKERWQQYWQSLPKEERQRLKKGRQMFQSSPQSEQKRLCHRFYQERGYLPPACQQFR